MAIGTPYTRGAGYFVNNVALKNKQEADVQLCRHCETVLLMQHWKNDGGFCGRCMAPICGPCADRMLTYGCEPFMKKIDRAFDAAVKLKDHLKIAGLDLPPAGFSPKIIVGGSKES